MKIKLSNLKSFFKFFLFKLIIIGSLFSCGVTKIQNIAPDEESYLEVSYPDEGAENLIENNSLWGVKEAKKWFKSNPDLNDFTILGSNSINWENGKSKSNLIKQVVEIPLISQLISVRIMADAGVEIVSTLRLVIIKKEEGVASYILSLVSKTNDLKFLKDMSKMNYFKIDEEFTGYITLLDKNHNTIISKEFNYDTTANKEGTNSSENINSLTETESDNIAIDGINWIEIMVTKGNVSEMKALLGESITYKKEVDPSPTIDFWDKGFYFDFENRSVRGVDYDLVRFKIKNNLSYLTIKGVDITIGDKINKLNEFLIKTYNNGEKGIIFELPDVSNKIFIDFDRFTNLITKIEYISF